MAKAYDDSIQRHASSRLLPDSPLDGFTGKRTLRGMTMKNHPNDTRCKRHLSRSTVGASGWLAHKYTGNDKERLLGYVKQLNAAGAKDIWVGDIEENDDGTQRVTSLWVALALDDKQDKKLRAKIIEIETAQEFEDPGEGIGFSFAEVTCG